MEGFDDSVGSKGNEFTFFPLVEAETKAVISWEVSFLCGLWRIIMGKRRAFSEFHLQSQMPWNSSVSV